MYYCYSIRQGLFDLEREYAKENEKYLFYDEKTDTFLDKDEMPVDISNQLLFPRTGVLQYDTLIDAIERHHGLPINTKEQYQTIQNWAKYIPVERKNIQVSGEYILEHAKDIIDFLQSDRIFFKTKEKNYSAIVESSDLLDNNSTLMKTIAKKYTMADFILSEPVEILEDEFTLLEYRFFIVDGKILNVSRVSDYLMEKIPYDFYQKAQQILAAIDYTKFPSTFGLDLFAYKNKEGSSVIDVLECNPLEGCGTYLYNSPFIKEYDVMHSCPSAAIPKEKFLSSEIEKVSYTSNIRGRASVFYEVPGGFANDLVQVGLFGEIHQGTIIHFENADSLSLNSLNRMLESMHLVESDNDFTPKVKQKTTNEGN